MSVGARVRTAAVGAWCAPSLSACIALQLVLGFVVRGCPHEGRRLGVCNLTRCKQQSARDDEENTNVKNAKCGLSSSPLTCKRQRSPAPESACSLPSTAHKRKSSSRRGSILVLEGPPDPTTVTNLPQDQSVHIRAVFTRRRMDCATFFVTNLNTFPPRGHRCPPRRHPPMAGGRRAVWFSSSRCVLVRGAAQFQTGIWCKNKDGIMYILYVVHGRCCYRAHVLPT